MMEQSVPELMVNGDNDGIRHSFQVTLDAFAQGDNRLVNYKTYYFMAIAYGHNEYEPFNPNSGAGQDVPYLASRKGSTGSIRIWSAQPHPPVTEAGGYHHDRLLRRRRGHDPHLGQGQRHPRHRHHPRE